MNPEIKQKWIAALRSGEYQQTQKTMCLIDEDGYKYCCLGVLCEVIGIKKVRHTSSASYDRSFDFLPPSAIKIAELDTEDPKTLSMETTLSQLNDTGVSFEKIADIIEREF